MNRIEGHGWWRDPDLDLAGLARRLGTKTAYLFMSHHIEITNTESAGLHSVNSTEPL
jgi:hypothetical protein